MIESICIFFFFIQSGYMNAITFNQILNIPSGYMSGIIPRLGFDLYHQKYTWCVYILFNYICFIIGGILTSVILYRSQEFQLNKKYILILLILIISTIYTEYMYYYYPFTIYYILSSSFTNGCQNAMTTIYSNGLYRTTHITGLTTDISIYIGKCVYRDQTYSYKLTLWIYSIFGLFIGSFLGIYGMNFLQMYAFIPNICFYLILCSCLLFHYKSIFWEYCFTIS